MLAKTVFHRSMFATLALGCLISGCASQGVHRVAGVSASPNDPVMTGLRAEPSSVSVRQGDYEDVRLFATFNVPGEVEVPSPIWRIDDGSIARFGMIGDLKGLTQGKTFATAAAELDGITMTIDVPIEVIAP